MSDIPFPVPVNQTDVPLGFSEYEGSQESTAVMPDTHEDGDGNDGEFLPLDSLAVEYFEGLDEGKSENPPIDEEMGETIQDAYEVGDAEQNVYTADMFNHDESDYKDIQKTYLESFMYSESSTQFDEGSSSNIDESERGIPLSSFNKIVKNVEIAEYETLQILFQLLYQRSAWDTQQILSHGILEFSGFNFTKNSEDYFNREVTLQTQPNDMLIKLGALLCLEIRMMLVDPVKAKPNLVVDIMEFLSKPKKKTRKRYSANAPMADSPTANAVDKCGCRHWCYRKFTEDQKQKLLDHLKVLQKKKRLDNYLLHLMKLSKIERIPGTYEDLKKFKEVSYAYQVRTGHNLIPVCKGAFMTLHGIRMGKMNQLQIKLKAGRSPKKLNDTDILIIDEPAESQPQVDPNQSVQNSEISTNPVSEGKKRPGPMCSKIKKRALSKEEIQHIEDDLKEKIANLKAPVPKIIVEKFNVEKVSSTKNKLNGSEDESKVKEASVECEQNDVKSESVLKLKDFSNVVKSIDAAPEELLIDVHFLLFLDSAEADKVKENILSFSGFTFDTDTEEFDERNEFLQRMSNKLVTDVSRCLSLGIQSTKEDTIATILKFLTKPDESLLRNSAMTLSLSDVELDDIGDMSDSDESITCEVVEKKVECIDIMSSGEDSDKEDKTGREKKSKQESPKKATTPAASKSQSILPRLLAPKTTPTPQAMLMVSEPYSTAQPQATRIVSEPYSTPKPPAAESNNDSSGGGTRTLGDFETICKIVNTHPHEYLVDIYDLLYLQKYEPSTLRKDILSFTGFSFEKGTQDYVKRKQLLDRMLYNSVRRIYNTLIHNTTEVKVFSKPTMISEIFQFLFKLPDHDTSVRPPLVPKSAPKPATVVTPQAKPTSAAVPVPTPALLLPNQTGRLSDLKRVFQRVACFPCEYLIDVHKLLFMTECDPKTIRQNIFAFKGFNFKTDSEDFQKRKMYLEYLTFHSLRKISSVLTTRSVDLRNSTKHELATHLTQVLAEYTHLNEDGEIDLSINASPNDVGNDQNNITLPASSSSAVENIVVTPIIDPYFANPDEDESSTVSSSRNNGTPSANITVSTPARTESLSISIVDTRSVNTPIISKTGTSKRGRKRKSAVSTVTTPVIIKPLQAETSSSYADINLPEVEQYRQLYGQNLNIYSPTITGITTFNATGVSHIVPQTIGFPIVQTYTQPLQVQSNVYQQPGQMIQLSSGVAPTMISPVQSKPSEIIVPVDCVLTEEEPTAKKSKTAAKSPTKNTKIRDAIDSDEEDCDKPLASLIGHPIDSVLKKHIVDIVEETDLQDITINGVIQKIFKMYPKYDLSYRKDFIKTTLRSMLYRLGDQKKTISNTDDRDTNSPDCSVTTTGKNGSLSESPETSMECS